MAFFLIVVCLINVRRRIVGKDRSGAIGLISFNIQQILVRY
jgi:hypothetical protein